MGCSFFLASLIYVLIENGYLAFVAGMVVGMVVFWRALGDKGLE
jgi:hypothetical protein